jgi:hypothetical protein
MMFQAKFSSNYQLMIGGCGESWSVLLYGPCPMTSKLASKDPDAVKREAYNLSVNHFFKRAIAEPPILFTHLSWADPLKF